jgi:hypothetical protein
VLNPSGQFGKVFEFRGDHPGLLANFVQKPEFGLACFFIGL